MLSCFKIRNFKSILDMTINFSYAEGKAPNHYQELDFFPFLETSNQKKFVPCLSFYGANASGKTNIIKAFLVFKTILQTGIVHRYFPNKLNPKYNYSSFCIEFLVGKDNFKYFIAYDAATIREETLIKNNKELYSIHQDKGNKFFNIVKENYSEEKLNNIIKVECSQYVGENKLGQTLPFLTKIHFAYQGLNQDINQAYNFIEDSLMVTLTNAIPYRIPLDQLAINGSNEITEQNIHKSFEKISAILRKFDIDIQRMSLNREMFPLQETKGITIKGPSSVFQNKQTNMLEVDHINSYHKNINGEEVLFNFADEESNGTNILLSVLSLVFLALQRGNVLIIDELDRALHPMIVIQLIQMFKDKRYNTKNAQLIFTSHATDILAPDTFRVSEVGIINKTLKTGTTLKRISDYEKVRNVNDFRRLYWNGVFGGLPFPYI